MILAVSLKELPQQMDTLRGLCLAGDNLKSINRQAHTMKGVAANISAAALRDISYQVETAAQQGGIDSVRQLLPALEHTLERTMAEIGRPPTD